MKKLIVFDMDQTLVDVLPAHDYAVAGMFRHFYGVDLRLTDIDFAGRSLLENFVELGRLKDIPEGDIRSKEGRLLATYESLFDRHMKTLSDCLLPGARNLIEALSRYGHLLALYTGDSPAVANSVMEATGLGPFFAARACGTEADNRDEMLRLVLARVEESTGTRFQGRSVVVVGDSDRDVASGKAVGALTVAVATGFHTKERLLAARPDYVFNDLAQPGVLEAILS